MQNAIKCYISGKGEYRFTSPRAWYLVGNGYLYPLKYIYALATKMKPSSFNTSKSIVDFRRLGFECRRAPKDFQSVFANRVEKSLKNNNARNLRLAKASKMPNMVVREVIVYDRNPDVVAEVLTQANGICADCNKPAPFRKRSNGDPYLEVHHIKRLVDGGEDTVKNAKAVCPNCHRKAHHG